MQAMDASKSSSPESVVVVALVTAACVVGDSMLYIVLPTRWQEAGLGALWDVGVLLSINRFIRLPLTPLAAWVYARVNLRTVMLAAVLLTGVLTIGYGCANGFWIWVVLRCVWGVAWTLLRMGAYLMILDCASESSRGALFGRYNGLFRLGSLLGMLCGGLVTDIWGLPAAAFAAGALVILAVPVTFWFVPAARVTQEGTMPPRVRLRATEDPITRRALLTGMVIALAYQGVVTSSLSHLIQTTFGAAVLLGPIVVGAASLSGVFQASRWAWEPWLGPWFGHLSDARFRRENVLSLALVAGAVLMALLPVQLSIGYWLVLVVGMQITATALTTVGDAAAADAAVRHSRTTVMTLYVMATDIGAAVGTLAGYFIAESWGTGSMYWSAAALLALTAAWWHLLNPRSA
jgi:MFS family permease